MLSTISRFVRRVHAWWRARTDSYVSKIVSDDNGFGIFRRSKRVSQVKFSAITKLAAYKRDLLAVDMICCDVWFDAPDGEGSCVIHEAMPGFTDLMERLETLPGFLRNWREHVVEPAFAENYTAIYVRLAPELPRKRRSRS